MGGRFSACLCLQKYRRTSDQPHLVGDSPSRNYKGKEDENDEMQSRNCKGQQYVINELEYQEHPSEPMEPVDHVVSSRYVQFDSSPEDFEDLTDSDLGSECLSVTYDSFNSDLMDDTLTPDEIVRIMTPDPRPYLHSRLGNHDNNNEEVIQWKKGNRLGKGSFGTVWCGLTVQGELIAIKEIHLASDFTEAEEEYEKIYQEVNLLSSLKHKNIVVYLGSCYEHGTIRIFMQYIPGGSLCNILARFGALEEPVIARYTRQILEALDYLHKNNVVHRDIKSANIMLMPDGIIKLIDFGCAKRLCTKLGHQGSNLQKSIKGTTYWMAPEVVKEAGHGKGADIWSLGCTVYEMCTGKPPWGNFEPFAAMFAIGADRPIPPLPEELSGQVKDFVNKCLTRDKRKRPKTYELLLHNFVSTAGN